MEELPSTSAYTLTDVRNSASRERTTRVFELWRPEAPVVENERQTHIRRDLRGVVVIAKNGATVHMALEILVVCMGLACQLHEGRVVKYKRVGNVSSSEFFKQEVRISKIPGVCNGSGGMGYHIGHGRNTGMMPARGIDPIECQVPHLCCSPTRRITQDVHVHVVLGSGPPHLQAKQGAKRFFKYRGEEQRQFAPRDVVCVVYKRAKATHVIIMQVRDHDVRNRIYPSRAAKGRVDRPSTIYEKGFCIRRLDHKRGIAKLRIKCPADSKKLHSHRVREYIAKALRRVRNSQKLHLKGQHAVFG